MNLLKTDKGLFTLFVCLEIIFSMLFWINELLDWTDTTIFGIMVIVPIFAFLSLRLDPSKRLITGFNNFLTFFTYLLIYNIAGMMIQSIIFVFKILFTAMVT